MKKLMVVLGVLALVLAPVAQAGTGVFGSYVQIDGTWYGCQQPGPTTLTAFQGLALGSYHTSGSLQITGGELLTWKSDTGDVTGADINWRVNPAGGPAGTFAMIGLGWTSNGTFNDAAGNTFTNASDQKWAQISSTPNVLTGLTAGNYELEVYFHAPTNEGDRYSSNGGANYKATFTVIPEPATVGLLGLVGVAAVLRRRFKRK